MLTHKLKLKVSQGSSVFKKTVILTCALVFLTSHFSPLTSEAAVSSDADYSIEVNDLDTSLPEATPRPRIIQKQLKNLDPSAVKPSETAPTYTIVATNDSFSFSTSQSAIDFGALTATNPVIRTSDMSLSTPFYGAQVMGYANHVLTNAEKTFLPDTTCDTGTCTQSIPANWENDLTYGFGYQCKSASKEVCGKDFSGTNSFKQFADVSANESPQTIILNEQSKRNTSAKLTYKVNISGTQPLSGYSNVVTYIAIPNF